MNIYNVPSCDLEKVTNSPICERGKLDTGLKCCYDCKFCYYKEQLKIPELPLNVIKQRIDYLKECEVKEIDLSGGESSIHSKWFEILGYCKEVGFEKISCLSNGIMFSENDFTKSSKDAGLEEIMFSLHGYDAETHDGIVGRKNAFVNILKAIQNAKDNGLMVRINCTICDDNYKGLSSRYVELLKDINPFEVNFITLNYWADAKNNKSVSYENMTDEVKRVIDKINQVESLNDMIINVRYVPYCHMIGYEKYVCNTYQHIYDLYDWNIALYEQDIDPEEYKKDKLDAMYKQAEVNRLQTYKKYNDCIGCKFYYICDGIEKEIDDEVKPVYDEEQIKNPVHYRGNHYESTQNRD